MSATEAQRAELAIEGMSCAACAARVERALNELDGVEATVNYATAVASVRYDGSRVALPGLVREVERAGYGAHLPEAEVGEPRGGIGPRLAVAAALTLPVALLGMIPALRFVG